MAHIVRKATCESKDEAERNHHTFSMEEVEDVLELIMTKQWPDIHFSDDEVELWSMMRRKMGINY